MNFYAVMCEGQKSFEFQPSTRICVDRFSFEGNILVSITP